jgi:rSAM/selenodomain-associated transferase 2
MLQISVIIPALNEGGQITGILKDLSPVRAAGHEVIVVDGGSSDDAVQQASGYADQVIAGPKGRARQMNAGADKARGDVLWFLHADTRVPGEAVQELVAAIDAGNKWGRFNVRLSGSNIMFRLIESMMNLRSCLTGIATGDQGIFVQRSLFDSLGAYPDIALMEDVALSASLKKNARPVCLRTKLVTSSRKWEQHGIVKTILLMWRLRLAYALGADPDKLAKRYYS